MGSARFTGRGRGRRGLAVGGAAVGLVLGASAVPAAAAGASCGTGHGLAAAVDPACFADQAVTIPLEIAPTSLLSLFNAVYDRNGFPVDTPATGSQFTVDSAGLHTTATATGESYVVLDLPVAPGAYAVVQPVAPDGDYWPLGVSTPEEFDEYDPADPAVVTIDVGPWQDCQLGLWNRPAFERGRAAPPAPAAEVDTPFPPSLNSDGWTSGPFDDRKCVERARPDGYGLFTVTGSADTGITGVRVVDRASGATVAEVSAAAPGGPTMGLDLADLAPGVYDVIATASYSTAGTHTVGLTGQLLDPVTAQASFTAAQDVPCPTSSPAPTLPGADPAPAAGPILPRTGSDTGPWLLVAVGLLVAGTAVRVAARRRAG